MDAIERALQTLGLGPDATPQDIRQAYRDLVVVWHPDRFPKDSRLQRKAEENLKEINKAYEILRGYDPASRVRSGPHTTLWAWPNPAQDRPGAGAPRQSSSAPTSRSLVPLWAHIIGTMSRSLVPLWAYIAGMMSRSPVPLWAYITGTIIAICLVGYVIEAPKTSRRPIQSTPGNGPSIGSPEELSPPSKPTGPPIGLPPDDANRGEYSSREGASDRGASSSLAGGGPPAFCPKRCHPGTGSRLARTIGARLSRHLHRWIHQGRGARGARHADRVQRPRLEVWFVIGSLQRRQGSELGRGAGLTAQGADGSFAARADHEGLLHRWIHQGRGARGARHADRVQRPRLEVWFVIGSLQRRQGSELGRGAGLTAQGADGSFAARADHEGLLHRWIHQGRGACGARHADRVH